MPALFPPLSSVAGRFRIDTVDQLPHHKTWAFAIGKHYDVCQLGIERIPNRKQPAQYAFRIVILQQ
jgi:hypothetical protein